MLGVRSSSCRRSWCAVAAVGLTFAGLATAPGAAHAASATVALTSLTTTAGSTGGQAASVMNVLDQSGTTSTWDKYVEFNGLYAGYATYNLPASIGAASITQLQVRTNYRGPATATQTWRWSLYNWVTSTWSSVGTQAAAPDWGAWQVLTFSATGTMSNYVSAGNALRVQLTSNNSADAADIDYMGVIVTTAAAADSTPPTTPTALVSTGKTSSSVSLSWGASSDNVGVTGYEIYRDPAPTPVATVTGTTATIGGLAASTTYAFTVKAADAAGNRSGVSNSVSVTTSAGGVSVTLPPANGQFDYQIGGPYNPVTSVQIVDRDHTVAPVAGKYNVCYINAFQTQPGESNQWPSSVILKNANGTPVSDPGWPGEYILDTRTAANRTAIMNVLRPWFQSCKNAGYLAIEPDNLDSYTRSTGLMHQSDNVAMAQILTSEAHALGLAIAQKNDTSIAPIGKSQVGFDFAIVEECQPYGSPPECGTFISTYGNQIYEIEYTDNGGLTNFNAACAARGASISITYRDRNVVPAGASGYVYQSC